VSGSNCCDPERVFLFLRKPDGSFAPRREVRFKLPGIGPAERDLMRGTTRPHLLDWDRDGHTDLVIGHMASWTLHVSTGPLAGKAEVEVKPFALPAVPDGNPYHFAFADWDGDGQLDLLTAVQNLEPKDRRWNYGVYWFRNTSAAGEPKFAAGSRLLTIPPPWELDAFAVADWGQDGRSHLVVSMSKNWRRRMEGPVENQLWLYRRKAEPSAAADPGRR
jgi:hypothetical protein